MKFSAAGAAAVVLAGAVAAGGSAGAAPVLANTVLASTVPTYVAIAGSAVLYQLAGTTALRDVLPLDSLTPAAYRGVWCEPEECAASETHPGIGAFDVQSPAMRGYTEQVTLSGYDTMTGLGTPNGQDFITALRAFP